MKSSFYRIIYFIILSLIIYSCKKDKDEVSPVIIVNSPYENQEFDVFDTINVNAQIEDETKIESIEIVLTNENFIAVLSSASITPNGKKMDIKFKYEINDYFLESGFYYLLIRASDGINTKHSYTKISIYESPKYLKYILAVTDAGSDSYELIKIDSSFNSSIIGNGNSEVFKTDYSSRYQQIYIAGQVHDDVEAIELPSMNLAYSISCVPNPPAPYFTNIKYTDKLLYVLFYDGNVKAYDNRGNIKYSTLTSVTKYPLNVFRHSIYLLIYQKDYVGLNGTIGVCFYPNSSIVQSLDVNCEIIDFVSIDNDEVLIFANKSNNAKIYSYNIKNNISTEVYSIPNSSVKLLCQIDADKVLLAIDNELLLFNYNSLSLTTYISNIFVKSIKFDEVNNIIYIAESNKVSSYIYPSTVAIHQTVLNDNIIDFHLVYNK